MRARLKVKIKAHLTINGITPPNEYGLFTRKGVEWLHGLQSDTVESYLPILSTLTVQVERLSKELRSMAPENEDVRLLMTIPGAPRKRSCAISNKRAGVPQHMLGEPYRHAGRQCMSEARAKMRIRARPHRDPRPLACAFSFSNHGYEEKSPFEAPEVMTLC
jgi:hypothetical protein